MEKLEPLIIDQELLVDAKSRSSGAYIHRIPGLIMPYVQNIGTCNECAEMGKKELYWDARKAAEEAEVKLREFLGGLRKEKRP